MKFEVSKEDDGSAARLGHLTTDHGQLETPIFMPVGTLGSVKGVNQAQLESLVDAKIILGNTYHLYLRPGLDVIGSAGGLHKFISWDRPLLTDSGGYQIYSLSERRKLTDHGVTFTSHIDGSKHFFSPESVIDIQRTIGADIMMALDECTPYPCDRDYAIKSLDLTHRWLERCIKHDQKKAPKYGYNQTLAPIVQGSVYRDLRLQSSREIAGYGSMINAIGGLSVGEPSELLYEMTGEVCANLPKNAARYLMGVGTPIDLLECIALGVDMFDCVLPSRNARHGLLYTTQGVVNIKNLKWAQCHEPIDDGSTSPFSRKYSKAYLRHLIRSKEMLGAQVATLQNLCFYLRLMEDARENIRSRRFSSWKEEMTALVTTRI
ncbi:MAG: tRNA guanosine(34) transglycosylase Tgt [Saprospiraceae bacterium]|nr:tRNA guanosine(34) transglycosylase Tgt [Saprospiraceae bacterium]